ncbi:MAG: GntP family permease [Saprospiraceae bacterium]
MSASLYLFGIISLVIIGLIVASSRFKVHPFILLLFASLVVGIATSMPLLKILETLQKGFGDLIGYIGLVVVLGSILGVALEKSGAALRLADAVLQGLGKNRPTLGMSLIGTLVGVPVFCDSGFIILSGLNHALALKSNASKASLTLALASGLYTTHTLVPPTPGPIAAAGNLGASDYIGLVMLLGLVVSIPVVLVAYFWAKARGRHIHIETPALPTTADTVLPPLWRSLLPIILPVVLIGLASLIQIVQWEGTVSNLLRFIGQPLIALAIGTGLAFWGLSGSGKSQWITEGIALSGPILIITGAGGAFGAVLKATPLAESVQSIAQSGFASGSVLLLVAFGIAALFKTMQGSSTSALVITSSMLAPLLPALGFDTPIEIVLTVLAVGAGAMTVSHANDSYFWVVTQFSGLSVRDAYRTYTLMTGLQGLTALATVLLLYFLFT